MISQGVCLVVIVVNLTSTWNKVDQTTLDRAKIRCQQLYPDSPCLKKFIKKPDNIYNAICSERRTEWLSQNMKK